MRAAVTAFALSVVLSGCYAAHGRGDDGAPGTADGGAFRDAGSARRDAGSVATRDAAIGSDAEVPLPRGPIDEPGPDERPSDDPGAGDWEDDPGLAPGDPCCEPIGPAVDIPFASEIIGGLAMAWNGDGWGVLYTSIETASAFAELDRMGRPIGPIRRYDIRAVGAELTWDSGRFGALITSEGSGPQQNAFALLDRRGVVASGWTELEGLDYGARIGRLGYRDRWIVVGGPSSPTPALELTVEATEVDRVRFAERSSARAAVVGLKSRVVVFWSDAEEVRARVLSSPVSETLGPVIDVDARGAYLVGTRLRDRAVAFLASDATVGGRFVTVDPFEMTVTSAPLPPTAEPIRQRHDAIGLDGPGVIASCSGVMDAAFEGYVELELYTADGQPAGAPVRVSTEPDAEIAWPCAVGSDGERIFVAWQLHERDVVRVRGYRLRR